jgi:hypothetical protein
MTRETKRPDGLPPTCQPYESEQGVTRKQVYDPALKQFPNAFRLADPICGDPELEREWRRIRRLAMDHVLEQVAHSSRGHDLILRGSRLLPAWLGWGAREPGDLDYIVYPHDTRMDDPWSAGLFQEIVGRVAESASPPGVEVLAQEHALSEIWTYERAPGRRLVIPWRSAGLPAGIVQMDVVFGEYMPDPPAAVDLPVAGGKTVSLRAATAAQSLAWKILWLVSDYHPQGKDLYDATLLAERVRLPAEILANTLKAAGPDEYGLMTEDFLSPLTVDWENFAKEYPNVKGSAVEWKARLVKALLPTFDERPLPWDRKDLKDED